MIGISEHIAITPIRKEFLGFGDEAIENTLRIMRDIINKASGDYYVRRWAEKIIESSPKVDIDRIAQVFYFLVNNTKYVKDTLGIELLKTPRVSLQLLEVGEVPLLDCDDYVILSLSLLQSIGYPTAMRAIAVESNEFEHVYGIVKTKEGWIPLDLTKPEKGVGWEYPKAKRVLTVRVGD